MYFRLALGNVRKSFNDYLIYFLTLTFSICLFFAFNSFEDQQAVFDMTQVQSAMMESAALIMNFLSIFVGIILAFLILYANNFLIKRRKKEFGMLMILGMPKNKISRILCYETVFIGIVSMFFGLLLGFFLSQGLTVLTASLFATPITRFRFIFSMKACVLTILSFTAIFFVVMIFNTFLLNKYRCIDLLYADLKNEKVRIKNTALSLVIFAISLLLLGYAYTKILSEGLMYVSILGPVILSGSLGTLLFFMSLSGFLLKFIQTSKKIYFKGLNMFVLKQISSNMNTNFISMSVVSIMLLLSIGALSTGLSMNHTITNAMNQMTPYDLTLHIYNTENPTETLPDSFASYMDSVGIDPGEIFSEIYFMTSYMDFARNDDPLNLSTTYENFHEGIPIEEREKQFSNFGQTPIEIYRESIYNEFLTSKGYEPIQLANDEMAFFSASDIGANAIKTRAKYSQTFEVNGKELKVKDFDYPFIATTNSFMNESMLSIVIPDHLEIIIESTTQSVNLNFLEGIDEEAIISLISNIAPKSDYALYVASRQEILDQNQGLKVTFTYVGIYLGFVFLIASCVILALQQLSQAADNRRRYGVLNKIGVDQTMRNASIKRQIGIYFLMPLLIGVIHSIVGITVMNEVVQILGKTDVTMPSIMTALIIIAIYGTYFYATYIGYKRILNQK